MDWSSAYEVVSQYIVSIETPNGAGTGFLFMHSRPTSLVGLATAAHVVDYANDWRLPIRLTHSASKTECFLDERQRTIIVNRERDAGSIVMASAKMPGLPLRTLPLIGKAEVLPIGAEVGWMGFPSIAEGHLCFFSGRISAQNRDEDSYYIDGVAINGVSGGPVFYVPQGDPKAKSPIVVGVVTAYKYNETYENALPGLLQAQDLKPFHEAIRNLKQFAKSLQS